MKIRWRKNNMLTKELKLGITETVQILKFANKDELEKIPKKFMNFLNENVDKEYKFEIASNTSLRDLKIRKETKNILGMIAYNYWSDTSEKKIKFKNILKNNQKIFEKNAKDKYSPNDLFQSKEKIYPKNNEINAMVEYKENIFKKIYKFLLNIFKKKN